MDKVERWLSTLADQEIDGRAGLKMLGNMSPEELKGCLTTCGLTQGAVGLIYQAINERRPSNHSAPSQSPGTVTITRHQSVGPLSPPSFAAMQPPPPRTPGSVDCASASALLFASCGSLADCGYRTTIILTEPDHMCLRDRCSLVDCRSSWRQSWVASQKPSFALRVQCVQRRRRDHRGVARAHRLVGRTLNACASTKSTSVRVGR